MGNATATRAFPCQPMPLSFLKSGETALVERVRTTDSVRHHLETLGFVHGAHITVRSEVAGNLIVEVIGAQVALNKQVASRIITRSVA